jgi:chromosomal replication initiator protein
MSIRLDIGRPTQVLDAVGREFGYSVDDITGPRRFKNLAFCRHVAVYMLRQTGLSLPETSYLVGGRDHTTALHSERVIRAALKLNPVLEYRLNRIREVSVEQLARLA